MKSRVRSGETENTMSETEQAEEADDGEEQITQQRFIDRLKTEGLTLDGTLYCTTGNGKQTRFHTYDPGLVKGFDTVRDDDGNPTGQRVANHEEAKTGDVTKSELLEDVYPKVADGFGAFGVVIVESDGDSDGGSSGSSGSEPDYEPMDDDELMETIRRNYDEHGLFAEDEDGETKVVSLAHPGARLMGYITGSHVKSLPSDSLQTVDDYRAAVYQALGADLSDDPDEEAEPIQDFGSPDEVPIATGDMMERFREAGNSVDEETREKIAGQVKARWEDGEYDHLRSASSEEEGDGGDE